MVAHLLYKRHPYHPGQFAERAGNSIPFQADPDRDADLMHPQRA